MELHHILSLKDVSRESMQGILRLAAKIKRKPENYMHALQGVTLVMLFAKPSLRTHLSFDVAIHQLGGHPIFYDLSHSTLGKKESMKDFSKVVSRYVDVVMARLFAHQELVEMANHAEVPVINGLTDYHHPCQILGDLLTIEEHCGPLAGKTVCFVGDANNNITHSLIEGCNALDMQIVVSCPNNKTFLPNPDAIGSSPYMYEKDARRAVKNADVVYADSWMSYHIPKSKEKERIKILKPYQVNESLMAENPTMKFMHCLPATRGIEVTDSVMDSENSIVYDQAENRLHVEKAILMWCLGKG